MPAMIAVLSTSYLLLQTLGCIHPLQGLCAFFANHFAQDLSSADENKFVLIKDLVCTVLLSLHSRLPYMLMNASWSMKLPGLHNIANPKSYHFTDLSAACEQQQRQKGVCVTLGQALFTARKPANACSAENNCMLSITDRYTSCSKEHSTCIDMDDTGSKRKCQCRNKRTSKMQQPQEFE